MIIWQGHVKVEHNWLISLFVGGYPIRLLSEIFDPSYCSLRSNFRTRPFGPQTGSILDLGFWNLDFEVFQSAIGNPKSAIAMACSWDILQHHLRMTLRQPCVWVSSNLTQMPLYPYVHLVKKSTKNLVVMPCTTRSLIRCYSFENPPAPPGRWAARPGRAWWPGRL